MNASPLEILADAIADVGDWRWWVADLPDRFQVEFGGVQLWSPPTQEGGAPSGIVALRFLDPTAVAFLARRDADDLPADWRAALHEDRIEPFGVAHDEFSFEPNELVPALLADFDVEMLVGDAAALAHADAPASLAFRAGDVGLIVRAREMRVVTSRGETSLDEVVGACGQWWSYWREYWRVRGTDQALPQDYACEVTIPLADG